MGDLSRWIESETLGLLGFAGKYGKLRIPSYQRGYEWNAYNVQRLVYSVFDGIKEQTFLGTMQIALDEGAYYIVDGRQRLTTLTLFHAVLSKRLGLANSFPLMVDDPMLEETLRRIENEDLPVFLTINRSFDVNRLNRQGKDEAAKIGDIYFRNAAYINTILESPHFQDLKAEDIEEMFDSIFLIAVSIKERELTQVIRIFDTLNSTGQELSDEAMFKLRYHSYLRSFADEGVTSSSIMEGINAAYAKVVAYNASDDKLIPVAMRDILRGYRTYLQTFPDIREKAQAADMALSNLPFYETLFGKLDKSLPILGLEEFHRYIDFHLEFYRLAYPANKSFGMLAEEEAINRIFPDLLLRTRYGRNWVLPVAFYARERHEGANPDDAYKKATGRTKSIFQVLYFYSVVYQRSVKRVKTSFLFNALEWEGEAKLNSFCKEELLNADKARKNMGYRSFYEVVRGNFYSSYDQAYAFLSVIEAIESVKAGKDFAFYLESVFPWKPKAERPQIEHIYCRKLFSDDPALNPEEKARLNGLGNFVFLEEAINKNALKDHAPSDKFKVIEPDKQFFPDSKYASVEVLRNDYRDICQGSSEYDDAKKWLEIVDMRYQKMKDQFGSLFDLLKEVE